MLIRSFVLLFGVLYAFSAEAQLDYVRKTQDVDFFVPAKALNRREVLPMPVYTGAKGEAVKNVKPEDEFGRVEDRELESAYSNQKSAIRPVRKIVKNNNAGENDFQLDYEDYVNDLNSIDEQGNLPPNQDLADDLAIMNSNERSLYKEFEL